MGLIDPSTSDGRVIFFLPWQGNTIAGTTDAPCAISQNPVAGEKDIQWILDEIRTYLTPDIDVQRSDILAAWSGEHAVKYHLWNVNTNFRFQVSVP
jgi:glycerol-3-phosphate dehydrogenase